MDLIVSFFFIFGIFSISHNIEKKYYKENSIIITLFIFTNIIGILYFFLISLFILNLNTKLFCIIILFLFSLLGFYTFLSFIKKNKIKFFLQKQNSLFYFIILILFLYLISATLPPADIDSLRYHLEIPKKIINNKFYEYITLDYTYLGPIEFINLFGLNFNFENTSSLLNFSYLLFLVISNIHIFEKYKVGSNNIGNLIVLSSPYLLSMISTQKIYLLPCFSVIYSFVYLILNKYKIKLAVHQLISSILIFTITVKTVFLFFVLVIFLFQIYLLRKDFRKICNLILTYLFFVILFLFPLFFIKFKIFGNPFVPFLDLYNVNANWLNEFKFFLFQYENPLNIRNLLLFPIKLILPLNFDIMNSIHHKDIIYLEYGNIFKLIGLGVIGIFFLKNKKNKIYIYLFLLILSFLFIENLQNRWFFPLLIFISIFYNTNNSFHKYFKKAILLQSLFTIIVLFFLSSISIKAKFFDKESVLNTMAYGYKFSKKIEREYPDIKILTFIENYYYLKNYLPLFKHELLIKYDKKYFSNNLKKEQIFILIYPDLLNVEEIKKILNINNIILLNTKTYKETFSSRFPLNKSDHSIYLYELAFK
jgi:hypothetical protein